MKTPLLRRIAMAALIIGIALVVGALAYFVSTVVKQQAMTEVNYIEIMDRNVDTEGWTI